MKTIPPPPRKKDICVRILCFADFLGMLFSKQVCSRLLE
jgi:hypothetical protein